MANPVIKVIQVIVKNHAFTVFKSDMESDIPIEYQKVRTMIFCLIYFSVLCSNCIVSYFWSTFFSWDQLIYHKDCRKISLL